MLKWPARDQDAAVEHGAPLADQAIGDPAARQAHHVHHRGVEPVDRAGRAVSKPSPPARPARGHEQDEQRAHAVVAEALPHLGEEQRGEAARMAEERAIVAGCERPGQRRRDAAWAGLMSAVYQTLCQNDPLDASAASISHLRAGPSAVRAGVARRLAARGRAGTSTCVDVAKDRLDDASIRRRRSDRRSICRCTPRRGWRPRSSARRARLNPSARICAYGLYAPLNEAWLRSLGVDDVLGGEFEGDLAAIARELVDGQPRSVAETCERRVASSADRR